MKNREQTFNAIAEKEMHQWGLEGFKNTFPTLFKVIMLSMEQHASQEHSRKCEEAGRELPTKEEIEGLSFAYRTTIQQGKGFIKGYETCMERASKSLASLQSQLEAKGKEIEYLKHCEKAREEETEGWERLKVIAEENYPIEKIVGRDVSQVIEKLFKELKLQLEAKDKEMEIYQANIESRKNGAISLGKELQEAKADYESIKITLEHYERDIQEAKAEVDSVKINMLRFIEWRDTIGISKLFSIEQQYEQFLKESQLTQHKAEEK